MFAEFGKVDLLVLILRAFDVLLKSFEILLADSDVGLLKDLEEFCVRKFVRTSSCQLVNLTKVKLNFLL